MENAAHKIRGVFHFEYLSAGKSIAGKTRTKTGRSAGNK